MPSPDVFVFTEANLQLITHWQMERYISMTSADPIDRYLHHLIQGWMQYVAPLTPSTVDDVPSLKCVHDAVEPVEKIPEAMFLLLESLARTASKFEVAAHMLQAAQFSGAWPTIWIWVQYLYRTHLARAQLLPCMDATRQAFFARMYQAVVDTFTIFTSHSFASVTMQILESYPEILSIMADMWIRESRDKKAVNGFRCGDFTGPGHGTTARFIAQAISTCGSAEEVVHLACQRVKHNFRQAEPDYDMLHSDLMFFTRLQPLDMRHPSPLVLATHASSEVVVVVLCALAHATSPSHTDFIDRNSRDGIINTSLSAISFLVLRSPRAHERVIDILHHDFIPLFISCVHLVDSGLQDKKSPIYRSISFFNNILSPATVHREIMSLMRRSIRAAYAPPSSPLTDMNDLIRLSCGKLWSLIQKRTIAYNQYRTKSSRCVILCGNAKVCPFTNLSQKTTSDIETASVIIPTVEHCEDVLRAKSRFTAIENVKQNTGWITECFART